MIKSSSTLQEISPDAIKPNPDNPRLIFHENEMTELLESIRTVGIKVPLTVFVDDPFTIIDGERRWRCAKRLNLSRVPVVIQPKPSPLENLLMMFNIHKVRVDWDVMPTALKLREVSVMLSAEGKPSAPKDLAGITGLSLPTVRRYLELLDLPLRFQKLLLEEAEKPRSQQRIKADLFIEIYKSLHVIERYIPTVFLKIDDEQYVDAMVEKYINGTVVSVTSYRELSKIARAELAGVGVTEATSAITRLVLEADYSIEQAYHDTVEAAYERRDLVSKVYNITDRLSHFNAEIYIDDKVRKSLQELRAEIDRLLRQ